MMLSAVIPACLFAAAVSASLMGSLNTRRSFDHFLDRELKVSNGLSEMHAQGLQMGQALRNIVLDPANRKGHENFQAAGKTYDQAYAQTLAAAAGMPALEHLQSLRPLRERHAATQARVLDLVKTDPASAMRDLTAEETPAWRALKADLLEQIGQARAQSEVARQTMQAQSDRTTLITLALALVALLTSVIATVFSQRAVIHELGGEPADARRMLQRVASGDLTGPVDGHEGLMGELATMQASLRQLVGQVRASTASISTASGEIATGNLDLSSRTEQTASNLQQTAASMEQLTGTVRQTADSVQAACQLAASAQTAAVHGGDVFSHVVATMNGINTSSRRIADIIGVIDSIAFQTNILALNAAVEAARASEQGRGFAVVASEVRSLAQRSATAAQEIKALIGASVEQAESGARLVQEAGSSIEEIVASVRRVSDVMGGIATSAAQQSDGLGEVNDAVAHLDHLTQQNAALVEQSAAATESLKDQAGSLSRLVDTFHL
jgi:methyl-accepting chemotaxis protein